VMHVGARVVGKLCEHCLKPGGCAPDDSRQFAGKVLDTGKWSSGTDWVSVKVTHCESNPELIGEDIVTLTDRIAIID